MPTGWATWAKQVHASPRANNNKRESVCPVPDMYTSRRGFFSFVCPDRARREYYFRGLYVNSSFFRFRSRGTFIALSHHSHSSYTVQKRRLYARTSYVETSTNPTFGPHPNSFPTDTAHFIATLTVSQKKPFIKAVLYSCGNVIEKCIGRRSETAL